MTYQGQITLNREVTFTQATQLKELFEQSKPPLCLELNNNGKAIQWNGAETVNLANHLAVIVSKVSSWHLRAFGVISYRPKKPSLPFDIVVLNNQVKIYRDGKISPLK